MNHLYRLAFQLRRTRGWRMPDRGFSVARPTIYGNPFTVAMFGLEQSLALHSTWIKGEITDEELIAGYGEFTGHFLVTRRKTLLALLPIKRGLMMGCFCPLPPVYERDRCHRHALLEVANPG